jgi:hypothetical protein
MEESKKKKAFGKPFTKGDPRINRSGRPKNFDALRELAKEIANSPVRGKDITIAEAILRKWSTSSNWYCQKAFLEIAFGKVPDKIELPDIGASLGEFAKVLMQADGE